MEAWIEYAQLLEHDVSGALDAYLKALAILENIQLDMAPEILNNIGCLYYMKNDLDQAVVSWFSEQLVVYTDRSNPLFLE